MDNFNGDYYSSTQESQEMQQQKVSTYIAKVMGWMALGLFTTVVAAIMGLSFIPLRNIIFNSSYGIIGVIILQIAVVIIMNLAIKKISSSVATVMFMVYSALTGITLSTFILLFDMVSLIIVFGLTTAIFLGMSLFGFVTKKDLTHIGGLATTALIGLIISGIINLFLRNNMLDMIICSVGILIFIALIAFDTQRIKGYYFNALQSGLEDDSEPVRKMAIYGALTLYLDFINLFLKLLRLLNRRR